VFHKADQVHAKLEEHSEYDQCTRNVWHQPTRVLGNLENRCRVAVVKTSLEKRISESGCEFQPSGFVQCTGLSVVGGGTKLPVPLCIATWMSSFGILLT
jgi:hypothetical protein